MTGFTVQLRRDEEKYNSFEGFHLNGNSSKKKKKEKIVPFCEDWACLHFDTKFSSCCVIWEHDAKKLG